uniref:Si:ch211-168d1.3 n=1 Tax=Sphaeramia orbicularis TaxID=375764 RepID=A0A673BTP6_9TELE
MFGSSWFSVRTRGCDGVCVDMSRPVFQMQVGSSQRGSQRTFSVLDRLLLTHPVWLQLSLNQDSAIYILLREPVGTFLVRKCSLSQRKVLCMRATADRSASSVKERFICEEDSNLALERAMFSCVLRPLRSPLEKALVALHNQDGSSQRLSQNMLRLKGEGAMERLGVRTGVPDSREVERVKQKLILMHRTHSPIDKILLLLQVCKCVHKAMGALHGDFEDFLPALSYVIVECNKPHVLTEVEYMMELLEPSWLGGEGGYYLTSVYTSLCLIQGLDKDQAFSSCVTPEAQEALQEWSCRRSRELHLLSVCPSFQRCVRILFQDGERSAVRTLQWRAGETSQALAQLCASTFGVSDPQQYTLYWRSGGEMRALPAQAQPQDLASHSEGGPSLSYLRTDHDFSKMRRLTRGGAVDLSESVCEE